MTMRVVNSTTGEVVETFETIAAEEVENRINAAVGAQELWRQRDIGERAGLLREAAKLLETGKSGHAVLMAKEMGKPIRDGRAEIEKCAWLCRHYAEEAAAMLKPEMVSTDAHKSYVTFSPLGVVLGVMPWNYPFCQVFRFAVPALTAGNAALLKHASNVPGCAMAIDALMKKAGFPMAIFQSVLITSEQVQAVIEHRSVSAAALTGSLKAGQAVAAAAGKQIKKTVLELGGSDPYLVLADADLDLTVAECAAGRLLNSGQSCIAAKRFIVEEAVRADFEKQLTQKLSAVRMGDPLDEKSEIGPLAGSRFRDELHRQVRDSIDKGARCLLGGEIPQGRGFFYPPTVLTDVRPGMPAFDEETFGPVAAIVPAADEAEAIRLANGTDFGLGAAVFTRDIVRGERIAAEKLQAGNCFVNTFVKSDPRLPFGGIKRSGYGRELSHYGIKAFVNIKTVYVA